MKAIGYLVVAACAIPVVLPASALARVICGTCPDAVTCASHPTCDGGREGSSCGDVANPGHCIATGPALGSIYECDTGADVIVCCECRVAETTFTEFSEAFLIGDDNPAETLFAIEIPGHAAILDMVIQVLLQHSRAGDLRVRLTHGTTSVTLMERPGVPPQGGGPGCEADLACTEDVYFMDSGNQPIECPTQCESCFPTGVVRSRIYVPNQALAAFQGQDAFGPWVLGVSDLAPGETGALCGWGVTALTATPTAVKPAAWGQLKVMYR